MEYIPSFVDQLDVNYISHYGVKGMRWGVRKSNRSSIGSASKTELSRIDKRYDKLAKKDAKEFARAKMSTGEGAGNRRKLIKATVEQRRKENKHYNDAFETYLAEQDMAKHATKARHERARKDAAKTTKRIINKTTNLLPYVLS